jgi:hypothetical protein
MRSNEPFNLYEFLTLVDPATVIPVIEKGIEIEKLQLIANPDCEHTKRSLRSSRALLSFLYSRRLGL